VPVPAPEPAAPEPIRAEEPAHTEEPVHAEEPVRAKEVTAPEAAKPEKASPQAADTPGAPVPASASASAGRVVGRPRGPLLAAAGVAGALLIAVPFLVSALGGDGDEERTVSAAAVDPRPSAPELPAAPAGSASPSPSASASASPSVSPSPAGAQAAVQGAEPERVQDAPAAGKTARSGKKQEKEEPGTWPTPPPASRRSC
jgi:hypothetical protein